jgi:hypothetical protein
MSFRRATATTHRIGCGAAQPGRETSHRTRNAPIPYPYCVARLALAGARSLIVRSLRSRWGRPLSRNGVRRPDADPIRKARFREAARAIVAKDRHDRKYGLPVDTAGAMARAMERAYREGFADAQGEPPMPAPSDVPAGETIDWAFDPAAAAKRILDHLPVHSRQGRADERGRASCACDHRAGHGRMAADLAGRQF